MAKNIPITLSIKIFEADFYSVSERWFEVQEYLQQGSLQIIIDGLKNSDSSKRKFLFNEITRETGNALNILHENGFLHRDIKPSNILIRSQNPLKIALIDFGIASALDSEMSKKATKLGGTPMYQSPESFSGVTDMQTGERRVILGSPTDWWGLGMILLEIASGSHPFKGLSPNVIAYSIATEAVNIPEYIDTDQRELLHGLLTRNPEKRWKWEQVSRWLEGERNIPNYFEENITQIESKNPYSFMGNKYYGLDQIAAAFAQNEESWLKGREHLLRGYVRQWLESLQEFDASIDLVNLVSEARDSDEKMFRFIQKYGKNIPFVFGGHAITLKNLFIFFGKALKRERLSELEQKIVDMILNGKLFSCLDFYVENNKGAKDSELIRSILREFQNKDIVYSASTLDFYVNPEKYYCPFLNDSASPENIIKESHELKNLPMLREYFDRMNKEYIIPDDIISRMKNASSYSTAQSELQDMIKNKQLISKETFSELNKKYILPEELLSDLKQSGLYSNAFSEILQMKENDILFLRENYSGIDSNTKQDLAASLDDYKRAVYRFQIGKKINFFIAVYRDIVERTLPKSEKGYVENSLIVKFVPLIAFLEFLSKRVTTLTDKEINILRNINFNNIDELESLCYTLINLKNYKN